MTIHTRMNRLSRVSWSLGNNYGAHNTSMLVLSRFWMQRSFNEAPTAALPKWFSQWHRLLRGWTRSSSAVHLSTATSRTSRAPRRPRGPHLLPHCPHRLPVHLTPRPLSLSQRPLSPDLCPRLRLQARPLPRRRHGPRLRRCCCTHSRRWAPHACAPIAPPSHSRSPEAALALPRPRPPAQVPESPLPRLPPPPRAPPQGPAPAPRRRRPATSASPRWTSACWTQARVALALARRRRARQERARRTGRAIRRIHSPMPSCSPSHTRYVCPSPSPYACHYTSPYAYASVARAPLRSPSLYSFRLFYSNRRDSLSFSALSALRRCASIIALVHQIRRQSSFPSLSVHIYQLTDNM